MRAPMYARQRATAALARRLAHAARGTARRRGTRDGRPPVGSCVSMLLFTSRKARV